MSRRWSLRTAALAIGAAALIQVAGVEPALGDASPKASCVGIEASNVSPPGSSDEFSGGMPELVSAVKAGVDRFGAAVSPFAKLHAGSHEACDAAG